MLTLSNFTESPVEITSPLKNIDALEKDTVTLSCELSKPNVTDGKWTFNGDEINTSDQIAVAVDGCTQCLVIENVVLEQQGQYSFGIGSSNTEATLFVGGTWHSDVWVEICLQRWLIS